MIDSQCLNISTFRPLSGSSYVKVPAELKSSIVSSVQNFYFKNKSSWAAYDDFITYNQFEGMLKDLQDTW